MIYNAEDKSIDLSDVGGSVTAPRRTRDGGYVVAERYDPRGGGWSEFRLVPDGEDSSACHIAHAGFVAVNRKIDLWNVLDRLRASGTRVKVIWP